MCGYVVIIKCGVNGCLSTTAHATQQEVRAKHQSDVISVDERREEEERSDGGGGGRTK